MSHSFVAAHIINRVAPPGWRAEISAPEARITSMNGVSVAAQRPLEFAYLERAFAAVKPFVDEQPAAPEVSAVHTGRNSRG